MAKKATSKPAAKAAKSAAASPALPTSNESAQPGAEQGMAAPLSPAALDTLLVETPPEVSGVLPPVAPLSDEPPEIVVGSERMDGEDSEPPAGLELPPVAAKDALADHPAIELAQSFVTPHGMPETGHPNYFTPPPPDLRSKAKR